MLNILPPHPRSRSLAFLCVLSFQPCSFLWHGSQHLNTFVKFSTIQYNAFDSYESGLLFFIFLLFHVLLSIFCSMQFMECEANKISSENYVLWHFCARSWACARARVCVSKYFYPWFENCGWLVFSVHGRAIVWYYLEICGRQFASIYYFHEYTFICSSSNIWIHYVRECVFVCMQVCICSYINMCCGNHFFLSIFHTPKCRARAKQKKNADSYSFRCVLCLFMTTTTTPTTNY